MAQALIGTSGFDYREWKPGFYPKDLPRRQFLQYYATRFRSVELDSTFYRMPSGQRITAWREATPEDFHFSLKASRKITHFERLKTPSDALNYLISTVQGLGERLGALLFQLPPFLKYDPERLEGFLSGLPPNFPAAFEFRNESWFTDETYRLLEKNGAALCINDGDATTTPMRVTSSFVYLRLRRSGYPADLRREWCRRIWDWTSAGIDVLGYIKHKDNPDAPGIAMEFAGELGAPRP